MARFNYEPVPDHAMLLALEQERAAKEAEQRAAQAERYRVIQEGLRPYCNPFFTRDVIEEVVELPALRVVSDPPKDVSIEAVREIPQEPVAIPHLRLV